MLDLDPGLPFRIDSLLGLPAESGSVLRLDPDTGTYFCEGIKIKVCFLRRDPDTGTFFAKGSRCRYVFCEGIQIQVPSNHVMSS
jgi:hypothetical protein